MTAEPEITIEVEDGAATGVLRPVGRVDVVHHAAEWMKARDRIEQRTGDVVIDLARADVDDGVLALLVALKQDLEAKGRRVELRGADASTSRLLRLRASRVTRPDQKGDVRKRRPIARLGGEIMTAVRSWSGAVAYVGDLASSSLRSLRHPLRINWRDLPRLVGQIGADALPIVLAINFLVGITLAYMGSIQAKQYGANIFVADMVAIAVARSLGPLMSAIIVAGRSGAGIAAELGTMKVSEEIDALRVLGLDPMRFLVLPRVLAVALSFPLLTLAGELAALAGGMLIGVTDLGLPIEIYLDRTQDTLTVEHVMSGLIKSFFFGLAIVLIACRRGLSTEGGAEGVGRATTTSVVQIIFQIVVLEAFFTVVFNLFDF